MPVKIVTIIRALYEGFSAQVVHNGQKSEPLNMSSRTGVTHTRLPAISLAVSGCPGLGDQESLRQEAWYSVVPYNILGRP